MPNFDPTSNADLLAVKSEVLNDPAGVGYGAVVNDQREVVRLLNEKTVTNVTRSVDDIDVSEIAAVINSTEYGALSEYDKEWVNMLITRDTGESLRPFKSKFLEIFPSGTTFDSAVALQQVPGSRMEILFEYGDTITRKQWAAARSAS